MQVSRLSAVSALALALSAAALTSPAQAAQAELYIDVATHAMPGMPGMGAMGRLAGVMGGQHASYGMTRHPGMPGRYMDVALHNRAAPGQPATQAVPKGLRLGNSIELLPRERSRNETGGTIDGGATLGLADGSSYRVRYFWGCGEQARGRQPVEYSMTVRNGKPVQSGRAMTPRQVPAQGPDIGSQHVLWPNPGARRAVSDKASLVGSHQLDGDGLPGAMQFALGEADDFLPQIELDSSGSPGEGMALEWTPVEGARGYFIHAMASQGDTIVMWSSSEDGYAGPELMDYLPESLLAQWTGKRTVLGADARSCRIPTEVFAGVDAAPMVQMVAYGSQRSIAQPRPADAARDWSPAWTVRVRSKSTAMLMPGMGAPSAGEAGKEAAGKGAKGLLRGLLGR